MPVISAGNVTQLSADLLIHTLGLRRAGVFDPSYHVPVVGGQDGSNGAGVSAPMELFGLPGGDVYVLQQRSPVLKDHKDAFVQRLLEMIGSSGFGSVLFLVGSDLSTRTDAQMSSMYYHLLAKDTAPDSISATSLGSLLGLPTLDPPPDNDDRAGAVIPGTGLARRLLAAPGSHPPRIALVQFVAEGDNIPDAHAMASMVANTLKIEIQGWKQPASWNFGMYGTPHDQQLFG
ncbi:hypothetical protein BDV93DRAFT_526612 [Ceratobasidium sp. AG-I]|nr:hypothetical protein BDV93DRAFT_526612 [Ceratobasidium sp. AG-I]